MIGKVEEKYYEKYSEEVINMKSLGEY